LRRGRWRRHPDRFDLGQAVGETFRHVCGHGRGRAVAVGDAHLAAMEALAAKSEGLSKIDRMQIDFALGKAYADLQDYPRSFRHLHAGNAAKRATIAYDEKATSALFGDIERIFASEAIKAKTGGGDPSQSPIFVVGMPRSGTTLIEQIIASHPMVHGACELQTFNDVVLTVRGTDGSTIPYPEFVPALDGAALRRIGRDYVARLGELARDETSTTVQRVTDKMPSEASWTSVMRTWWLIWKARRSASSPIAACHGMSAAFRFTEPSGRSAPRARHRSASPFIGAQSDVGEPMRTSLSHF
jgi:hypothetical protein